MTVRQYLLGELPADEAERLEAEYFANDDRFAELLEAEDDLIEAYLSNALTAGDRSKFEQRFLSTPRGRQKVALLESLEQSPNRRAWETFALAAAIALAILGGALWFVARDRHAVPPKIEVRPSKPVPAVPHIPVTLAAAERGSAPTSRVVLPPRDSVVDATLILPTAAHAKSYTVSLQSVDGRPLWSMAGVTPSGNAIAVEIPSRVLEPGTFVISVSAGGATVEEYSLTVNRR